MTDEAFVYDTYALLEIIQGNDNYKEYLEKKIIINDFIYAELCYILIRNNYPYLDKFLERHKKFIISVKSEVIKEAMKFRYLKKSKNMSMTDCISYFMAKDLGINFLTGDKEFEGLENVEFVK